MNYSYQVLSADRSVNLIHVRYSHQDRRTTPIAKHVHIDEAAAIQAPDFEAYVRAQIDAAAPLAEWEAQLHAAENPTKRMVDGLVGMSGTLNAPQLEARAQQEAIRVQAGRRAALDVDPPTVKNV